jgi:hypothetical protein
VVRRHLWRDSGRERPRAHGHRAAAPEAADQPLQRLAASRHHQVQARGRAAGVPKEDRSTSCPHQISWVGDAGTRRLRAAETLSVFNRAACADFSLSFSNSYRIWTRRRAVSCPIQRCRIAPAVGRADKHSGVRKAVRPLLHPGNCWNHTEITWIILVSPTASDLTRRGGRMAHAVLSWPRERPTRLRGQNKAHAHRTPQNTAVFDACTFACACTCTLRVHVSRAARTPGNPTESAARRASPLYSACRGR